MRKRNLIRPHAVMIDVGVNKEPPHVLVRFENIRTGRIRLNKNWISQAETKAQRCFNECNREDETDQYPQYQARPVTAYMQIGSRCSRASNRYGHSYGLLRARGCMSS